MKFLSLVIVSSVVVGVPISAHAEERAPRVAVVNALTVNVEAEEGIALTARLGAALRSELVVDVIAGAEAHRRLPDGQVPDGCITRPECIADIAVRLGADQVLFLVVVRLGDRLQIDPTWSDSTGQRTVGREAVVIDDPGEWDAKFASAAQGLLPDASKRQSLKPQVILVPQPAPTGRIITRGVWIAGGVGAAALVGAVSFTIATDRADDRLQINRCDVQPCDPSLVDSLKRRALIADLFIAATIGAGATAGVLYFLSSKDDEYRLEVSAATLPAGGALMVKGSF
jgi:hypothetical protein